MRTRPAARTARRWVAASAAALALGACTTPAQLGPAPSPSGSPNPSPVVTPGLRNFAPGAASAGDPLFPKEGDGGYDAGHYALTITYDPATGKLTGVDVMTANATQALSSFDLDLHGLTVRSVTVDGHKAAYTRTGDKLVITPAAGIPSAATFTTEVRYDGIPTGYKDPELGIVGFIRRPDGVVVQGEPDVAASWYAVNDTPRDKATYDITATVPSALSALSNGVLVDKTPAGANTSWHWRESSPMASYLATLMIGDYRVVNGSWHGLPMVLATAASLPTTVDATLARTPEVLDFLVTQFGPYPFGAVGGIVHDDAKVGFALENQTRPVYAPGFFSAGTDGSWVIAHELAHQWYGDDVSVTNWSDIWLNEGFATYAEWLWSQHEGAGTPQQIFDDIYYGRNHSGLPQEAPAAPTVTTVFGESSYTRGGATLQALRIAVGDDTFWRIVRGWPAERQFGNATTADFIAYADRVSGLSLDAFLHKWLYEPGTPPYPQRLG
ncbi:MAG TPA: M1 family metallopeptidase [Micromonosporaceae bacterium]|nr:M1 family metallopeptidase [Micromonosporaceae bacterium]